MSLDVQEKQVVQDNVAVLTSTDVDNKDTLLSYVGKRLRIYFAIAMFIVPLLYLINIVVESRDAEVSWIMLVYALVPFFTFELSGYLCDYRKPHDANKE